MKTYVTTFIASLVILPAFLACAATSDYTATVPEEFFASHSGPVELIDFEEWIIFEFDGTPSGVSSEGKSGSVSVKANKLEITIPTKGVTVGEILDLIVTETSSHSGLQGFPDHLTGRVLILSSQLVTTAGIHSRDSGIDQGWSMSEF